jgi:anti-sigma factor RsiW
MIGHLGSRVSALLDGQLPPDEEERAWSHVHTCHQCRDQVEREGWVKTRLAGLTFGDTDVPGHLKGSLLGAVSAARPPGDVILAAGADARPRWAALTALGGGAGAAAVMGVLALGAAPADAPTLDRRLPATSVSTPSPAHLVGSTRRAVGP